MRKNLHVILSVAFVIYIRLGFSQSPTITSFTPTNGAIGTLVTITGTNFDPVPINNIVYFGATQAIVTGATPTQLTVTVPTGATYQPLSVLVNGLTAYSSIPFVVTFMGGGSFNDNIEFPIRDGQGLWPINDVTIADLDGDGWPDLVVTDSWLNKLLIFKNLHIFGAELDIESYSFAANIGFTTGEAPISVAVSDLDGDGKPELATANFNTGTVSIFKNTTSIGVFDFNSFATKVDFVTGYEPNKVVISDLNGDGKPDLIVASSGQLSIFKNTSSTGSIDASSFAPKIDFETSGHIAISDLDGDGKPDLTVANENISIFKNTSTPDEITFAAQVDFITGVPYSNAVSIGDLEGDSKPDLVVLISDGFGSTKISVLRNTSSAGVITTSSFAAHVDFEGGGYEVAIADLDGNGKPDITTFYTDAISLLSVFKNTSITGEITANSFVGITKPIEGLPSKLAIGDLNGDSKPDLVVTNNATISIFQNQDQITGINDLVRPEEFYLYPNPAENELVIDLNGFKDSELIELTVYDHSGKTVLQKTLNTGEDILPINQLVSGIYVMLASSKTFQFVKRFIKK